MNTFQTIILISLFGNTIIGAVVFGLNPRRRLNRYFLLSTLLIAVWLLMMLAVSFELFGRLEFWTRQVSAAALLLPLGYYILRLAIMEPDLPPWQLWYRLRFHLLAILLVGLLCQTPFFVVRTTFAGMDETIPVSEYGIGIYPFILYFIIMSLGMVFSVRRTLRECTGIRLIESQFLLLGWIAGFSFGVVVFSVAIVTDYQEVTQFLPLFALILDAFVAYGLATKRILSVSEVLQRVVAYFLVLVVLSVEYALIFLTVRFIFRPLFENAAFASHLLATLAVALSVVPVESWMKVISKRIIVYDLVSSEGLLARAGGMIREILLEVELVPDFMRLVSDAFGVPHAYLLRVAGDGQMLQAYPEPVGRNILTIPERHGLLELLRSERGAITMSILPRMRAREDVKQARAFLRTNGWELAVGGFMRGQLKIVLLLQARKNLKIYDLRDQRALQILCDQFAVALENSYLYTEVQNARIYNEILLNALTSGIIAVDMDGRITMLNRNAAEMTGFALEEVSGKDYSSLPDVFAEAVRKTLAGEEGFEHEDVVISEGGAQIPLRLSCAPFQSHTGEPLGVLLVFTDMTEFKAMEEQIRRSDRLSSIGTLSAGMAHEIKNPLVTINTFTQLLPEQYDNAEFRETFFELVGKEARRIDTLVNRLLRFARPVKGDLRAVSLHACVRDALRLAGQQLHRSQIALMEDLQAQHDWILADKEQLNQAFVNLLLNAVDAMPVGGQLWVSSRNSVAALDMQFNGHSQYQSCVELTIRDTGVGIEADNLARIFDPFFTTKERGVGLGLSVTHGIIQEHHASVHVESKPGEGTTFTLHFPLQQPSDQTGKERVP